MSNWTCYLNATTHTPAGKRITMCRRFDGSGDVWKAALASLAQRKDHGFAYLGCEVTIQTPLHTLKRVLEWDGAEYTLKPAPMRGVSSAGGRF
jgi:hypothetical protein